MIYATCPTCGFLIASKATEYETKKNEICQNPKLSKEEQEKEIPKINSRFGIRYVIAET